ncbi:MAG: cell division ATP-binding protein FtsE [Oscillospiraceae bacterium]|nr:cell division ATP-binding protein FtsE [Oscillospiraceae bacterium]
MVRLLDVCKVYENGTPALSGINLKIDDGEFVFLVGSSASGKSTIVKILTSEVKMTSGRGIVNGFNLNRIKPSKIPELRRSVGIVFQDFRLIDKKTVYENVAFAMRAVGAPPRIIKKRVPYVLQLVGLEHKMKSFPNELSGGERQRVAVARALVNNPSMIIADEPTGNLDPKMSIEIMSLLEKINELGTTMLVVTHERELVNEFSKRVIAIDQGRIISDKMGGYYQNENL